jgi:hypothetical protein
MKTWKTWPNCGRSSPNDAMYLSRNNLLHLQAVYAQFADASAKLYPTRGYHIIGQVLSNPGSL